jgi:nucleotide-binding universal stress UspA family protein
MKTKKEFNRIILAVDGSKISKKAAKKALSLAKKTGFDVTAIHVVHVPNPTLPYPPVGRMHWDYPMLTKTMNKQGESILNEIKDIGKSMDIKVKTILIEGMPDDEIIKLANKNDLIIMGSKGHSSLDRILVGSVTEKVLHHSNATVMIVR